MNRKRQAARSQSRRHPTRSGQEKRKNRRNFVVTAIAIIFIMAIPAYGYYEEYIAPGHLPVVRVDKRVWDTNYFIKRLRLMQAQGSQIDLSSAPFELLQTIADEELVRLATPRFGIFVTEDEVSQRVREGFQLSVTPMNSENQKRLDTEVQQAHRRLLKDSGLSEAEYFQVIEASMLRERLRQRVGATVPSVAEQIYVQMILAETADQANSISADLKAGKDFAELAKKESKDDKTRDRGGELGWIPRGVKDSGFDAVAFGLGPGVASEPFVSTFDGYYIVKVLERASAREISEENRSALKDRALRNWLDAEVESYRVERYMDSEKYTWVVEKLKERK